MDCCFLQRSAWTRATRVLSSCGPATSLTFRHLPPIILCYRLEFVFHPLVFLFWHFLESCGLDHLLLGCRALRGPVRLLFRDFRVLATSRFRVLGNIPKKSKADERASAITRRQGFCSSGFLSLIRVISVMCKPNLSAAKEILVLLLLLPGLNEGAGLHEFLMQDLPQRTSAFPSRLCHSPST